jgi:hypothetical protein
LVTGDKAPGFGARDAGLRQECSQGRMRSALSLSVGALADSNEIDEGPPLPPRRPESRIVRCLSWRGRGGTGGGKKSDNDGNQKACRQCADQKSGSYSLCMLRKSRAWLNVNVDENDRDLVATQPWCGTRSTGCMATK